MSNGFFMYVEAQQRFSFETYWCRISWSIAVFKHFNVIEINEGSMYEEILVLFKSSRLRLCLTIQKKTRYCIYSTSHFGITSRIWISVFQDNRTCIYGHWIEAEMSSYQFITITDRRKQCGHTHNIFVCVCVSFSLSVCLPVAANTTGTDDKFPLLAHHQYTQINVHITYTHIEKNPPLKL